MTKQFGRQLEHFLILWIFSNLITGCRDPENNNSHPGDQRSVPENHEQVIRITHMEDLSYTLTPDFPYIHVHQLTFPFSMEPIATIPKNGVAANSWHIHEHIGTHIDAPNHFAPNGLSIDQIRLEDLIVPVVVIDITKKASLNKDAELTIEDIKDFEDRYGRVPVHSCVMMLSGWGKFVHTPVYMGLDSAGTKHFPGFAPAAVDFLVKNRGIAGIGVDVISFDPGKDNAYTTHKVLLGLGKWGIENIANLDRIPVTGATLIIGAPKIGKATGTVARIFAVW
jgi:kynurenine formamidase